MWNGFQHFQNGNFVKNIYIIMTFYAIDHYQNEIELKNICI